MNAARSSGPLAALAYPLQGSIAAAIVVFTLLLLLARFATLLGLFLGLVTLCALTQHLFLVLKESAMGARRAPVVGAPHFDPWQSPALTQVLVLTALIIVLNALIDHALGPTASLIAWLLIVFVLPASLAQLVVNGSLWRALNPIDVGGTVLALGPTYLLLMLWLALALALGPIATALGMNVLLADMLTLYSLYLAMHLIGRTLFAERDRIGLVAINTDILREQDLTRERDKQRDAMLDEVYQQSRTDIDAALKLVTNWLGAGNDDDEQRGWLLTQLKDWSDPRLALALAPAFVERALRAGESQAALATTAWALERNPSFRLRTADATLGLVKVAKLHQKPRVITALLDGFIERYPDSPHAPAATLLAAQLALEKTGETALAERNLALLDASGRMGDNATYRRLRDAL